MTINFPKKHIVNKKDIAISIGLPVVISSSNPGMLEIKNKIAKNQKKLGYITKELTDSYLIDLCLQ